MLTVNRYRDILLEEFYLDSDDMTVRRSKNGYYGRYAKDDKVVPYKLARSIYPGIHVPKTRTSVFFSHLVTLLRGIEIPENSVIDHIDGNPNNNTRSNLRVTTQQLNCRNKRMNSSNSTGYTGISKSADGYIVRKQINGKRLYLGYATKLSEAVEILNNFDSSAHGYTERHGKEGATTIPKGSRLKRAEAPSPI